MKNKLQKSIFIATFALFGLSNSVNAQSIGGAYSTSLYTCSDGTINVWGASLGNGSSTDYSTVPVKVNSLAGITAVTGGWNHRIILKNDGTVWTWGLNNSGQLGNGNNTNSYSPVQVSSLTGVIAIEGGSSHSIALKNDGTVWTWGNNYEGQLGNGTNIESKVPVQVSSLNGITAIAAGTSHSCALKNDGTVWVWGGPQYYGILGNGTLNKSNVPVKVSTLTGIIAIESGGNNAQGYSLALKNDGTVWAWGSNDNGQLGNGTNTQSNTPVQANGLSGVIAIDAGLGGNHSLALKNDGTVWTWGDNLNGQLGNGTDGFNNRINPIPLQISSLSGIIAIAGVGEHSLALKSDNTLWAWGYNGAGQLGNGTLNKSKIPVQVTGLCRVASAIEENLMENLIAVYPNPSGGIFQLTIDNIQSSNGELEIFNSMGVRVYSASNLKQQMQIDISTLSKGIYFVKVYNDIKIYYQKIIVN